MKFVQFVKRIVRCCYWCCCCWTGRLRRLPRESRSRGSSSSNLSAVNANIFLMQRPARHVLLLFLSSVQCGRPLQNQARSRELLNPTNTTSRGADRWIQWTKSSNGRSGRLRALYLAMSPPSTRPALSLRGWRRSHKDPTPIIYALGHQCIEPLAGRVPKPTLL